MSQYTSCLYEELSFDEKSSADKFETFPFEPSSETVLCRDSTGVATAIYGASQWDFNPYKLSARRISVMHFGNLVKSKKGCEKFQIEVKRILFYLIYNGDSGRLGRLSVATLLNYYFILRDMARFCDSQRKNIFVGKLTLEILLSNKSYLTKFVRLHEHAVRFRNTFKALLNHIGRFPKACFLSQVVSVKEFNLAERATKQTPVIPSRIYLSIINNLKADMDHIYNNMGELDIFIGRLKSLPYATSIRYQKSHHKVSQESLLPTFSEAVMAHGLENLLTGNFRAVTRKDFTKALGRIQFLVKHVIHLYTGMRDQEVMRLRYGSISEKEILPALTDDQGTIKNPCEMISVISTTSKFTGYPKVESWLAPDEVIKAVKIAEMVCRGLSTVIGETAEISNPYLFLGVSVLTKSGRGLETIPHFSKRKLLQKDDELFKIRSEDLYELQLSDPGRNFSIQPIFSVGSVWPLAFHQYRRSLSYYASNSGFVSQPTLKKQFKHATLKMAQYYSNNFENIKMIFGYFDEKENEYKLPSGHVAYEFQMGISSDMANQLLFDLLEEKSPLFGGAGTYIEKQRNQLQRGDILIETVRRSTENLVSKGQIAYKPTLLGGCTKVGPCNEFILGDITSCLTCDSAIIKPIKVKQAIVCSEQELSTYETDSGEFQICSIELEKLKKFQSKISGLR